MPSTAAAIACHHGGGGGGLGHSCVVDHPEGADRVQACLAGITALGLWQQLIALPARQATDAELRLCHEESHIKKLTAAAAAASNAGHALFLPANGQLAAAEDRVARELRSYPGVGCDTFVAPGSMHAARAAVGGMLALVDESLQSSGGVRIRRGLALCRPPGHHAGMASSQGFCLLNNVAVAAGYARMVKCQQVQRVLIFDWDVHHCQGTQEIFWQDPHVLVISAHRRDEDGHFYPGSGAAEETGEGQGLGYTVNVPLPAGYGDAALWAVCSQILLPAARRFQPDIIMVSAGFDAAAGDPLGEGQCTPQGFAALTAELVHLADEVCFGRLLLALEGGYALDALQSSVGAVAKVLVAPPAAVGVETFGAPPRWMGELSPEERSAIHSSRMVHRNLALRLMDGYATVCFPFAPRSHSGHGQTPLQREVVHGHGAGVGTGGGHPATSSPTALRKTAPPTLVSLTASGNGIGKRPWAEVARKKREPRSSTPPPPARRRRGCPKSSGCCRALTPTRMPIMHLSIGQEAWAGLSAADLVVLGKLGASTTSLWDEGVTHVIASTLRRSQRLMCAICKGQHVVTPAWLRASIQAHRWVDEDSYLLQDLEGEAHLGTTLRLALARARRSPLLQNFAVHLTPRLQGPVRRAAERVVLAASGKLLPELLPGFFLEGSMLQAQAAQAQAQVQPPASRSAGGVVLLVDVAQDASAKAADNGSCVQGPATAVEMAMAGGSSRYSVQLLFDGAMKQELCWELHGL